MKKGPRCPVCGSINIKECAEDNPARMADVANKSEGVSRDDASPGCGPQWRCGDCYRKFATPDKQSK